MFLWNQIHFGGKRRKETSVFLSRAIRPGACQLAMEAIALAFANRLEEAPATIGESVAENPEPSCGLTGQSQILNATVALSILNEPGAPIRAR